MRRPRDPGQGARAKTCFEASTIGEMRHAMRGANDQCRYQCQLQPASSGSPIQFVTTLCGSDIQEVLIRYAHGSTPPIVHPASCMRRHGICRHAGQYAPSRLIPLLAGELFAIGTITARWAATVST